MQHEFFPEFFSREELLYRRNTYQASAEEAVRVIAISQHVKTCLVEKYHLCPQRIDVIHNGFGSEFKVIHDANKLAQIKNCYNLDKPFLYYPARTWPHKNHKKLLAAVKIMTEKHGFDGDLVLSGTAFEAQGEIMLEASRLGLENCVKNLGQVLYADLPGLFNLARLMVYPSLFEGFGIPLVEAMASGCPVACSDRTSLPEVAGNAAVLFDPTSPEEMADKIWAAWSDEELRGQLIERGLQRSEDFSWEEMARKTIDVYRKTVENF
jgi:glycosyltransferase involved in cell wall biosynthesis